MRAMEGEPGVFITDEDHALKAAILELQRAKDFRGKHLLDSYHVLHNIRKRLRRKENVVLFSRVVHARNISEFNYRVHELRKQT